MKKIVVSMIAVLLLAGCSGGTTEKKTCSITKSDMEMAMTFEAKEKKIEKATIDVTLPKSVTDSLGEAGELSQKQLDNLGDNYLAKQGLDKESGIDVAVKMGDDGITISLSIDTKSGDDATLKKLGLDSEGDDLDFDKTVKNLTDAGFECK